MKRYIFNLDGGETRKVFANSYDEARIEAKISDAMAWSRLITWKEEEILTKEQEWELREFSNLD